MGHHGSKLSPKDFNDLKKDTSFKGQEIQDWYHKFHSEYYSGGMTREDFHYIYLQTFPNGDPTEFANEVFRVYDTDKDGKINFQEFMCNLSMCTRGSTDDKLSWAFGLYDLDENGYVEREEAAHIISAILKMRGMETTPQQDQKLVEEIVNEVFNILDKNNDDRLSKAEFVNGAKSCQTVLSLLQVSHH